VRAERIVHHVWGGRTQGDRQLLKQLVHRLRRKIEDDPARPRVLLTEPGIGYRVAAGEEPG
jgi:DNA-binding response OmpR family regulator